MSAEKYKRNAYWSYALRHLEVPKEIRKKVCGASPRGKSKAPSSHVHKNSKVATVCPLKLDDCFSKIKPTVLAKKYKYCHMHMYKDEVVEVLMDRTNKETSPLDTVLCNASSHPILLPFVYTPYTPTFTDFAEHLWFPRLRYDFKRYRERLHHTHRMAHVREGLQKAIQKRSKNRQTVHKKERKNRTEYRTNTLYYDVCFIIWWLTLYCRMEHKHNPSVPVHSSLEARYDSSVQALGLNAFYQAIGLDVPELMTYSSAFKKRTAQAAGHSLKNYIGGQHLFGCNVYQYAYFSTPNSSCSGVGNDLTSLYRHKFTPAPPTHKQVLEDRLKPILDPPFEVLTA